MIVISSAAALKNAPGLSDYVAAKGAVALAASVANVVAADRIRVNVVAPSIVNTPMVTANTGQLRIFRPDLAAPTLDDCLEVLRTLMPMGGPWVEPTDVAEPVVDLASPPPPPDGSAARSSRRPGQRPTTVLMTPREESAGPWKDSLRTSVVGHRGRT